MEYEIVKHQELSGKKATIYNVFLGEDENSLFHNFLMENKHHKKEIKSILARLQTIGHKTGARETFFKTNEGKIGDGVCALYDDPKKKLRLFCIRYGSVAIILGSGGLKNVESWQDDDKLTEEAENMINLSKDILQKLKTGELKWSPDGMQLLGNLIFSDDEK